MYILGNASIFVPMCGDDMFVSHARAMGCTVAGVEFVKEALMSLVSRIPIENDIHMVERDTTSEHTLWV